jgi:hypothetical protein
MRTLFVEITGKKTSTSWRGKFSLFDYLELALRCVFAIIFGSTWSLSLTLPGHEVKKSTLIKNTDKQYRRVKMDS